MWSFLCVVISGSPQLLIHTAMSLDYTTESAASSSQSCHRAPAHKTVVCCGSGGQLHCRLMLLTVNLFIQGSGCPSFSPGPGKQKKDALYDVAPAGGTSLLTAET